MGDWPEVTLRDVAAANDGAVAIGPFGSAMKADTYTSSGVPVIRGTNISADRTWKGDWVFISEAFADAMPRCVVTSDDLVFPHRGSIGEVAIVPERDHKRYFLSTSLMKITLDTSRAVPGFVYYFFKSVDGRNEILKYASQVGTPGIGQPLSSLRKFRLPLPPLVEQQKISAVLSALDDKIDLNRRMNETLEAMARAIFKDWFVDFGPTQAKMEGRAPYLAPEIWALFPGRLNAEGKPEGWDVCDLNNLVELNPSEGLPKGTLAPYIDMAALPVRGSWPDAPILREAGSGARFRNGDTLFARITPCLENGKTAYVTRLRTGEIAWGSTEFIVIRPRPPVPLEFAYLLARNDSFRTHAIQSMTGTSGRQRVQPEALRTFGIVRASDHLLRAFGALVSAKFQKIASNALECETLASTRDLLLPKLMSGEIRVKDAETMVGIAV